MAGYLGGIDPLLDLEKFSTGPTATTRRSSQTHRVRREEDTQARPEVEESQNPEHYSYQLVDLQGSQLSDCYHLF